ncbi:hypothetical protein GF406_03305 [candidate division KSB1 bacterium]|nr:hypothetical protein [candidate division KSB1 bacterium]
MQIDSIRSICLIGFSVLFGAHFTQAQVHFDEVSNLYKVRGFEISPSKYALGHGIAVSDINGDRFPELYISNAVREADQLPELLYMNHGNPPFQNEAAARGVADPFGETGTHGVIFVDIDNDGDLDIFNGSTDERNHLYINRGNGTFYDGSHAAGISVEKLGTRGVVAFDANGDGYMDLFAANWYNPRKKNRVESNEFYLNRGNGTFQRTDAGLTRINSLDTGVQGVTAADIDEDGDVDLILSRRVYPDPTFNQVMLNDGTGHFTEKSQQLGLRVAGNDCNGTTLADLDNDGDLDILFTNHPKSYSKPDYLIVFENKLNESGRFEDISQKVNIRGYGFTVLCIDVDNDTYQDIFLTNTKEKSSLYLNKGDFVFEKQENTGAEHSLFDPRAVVKSDFDRDGDLDIYLTDANKDSSYQYYNRLLQNKTRNDHHWLKIDACGPRGDRGGFGSKVWIYAAGHVDESEFLLGYQQIQNAYGYLAQDDPVLHFGLGHHSHCDVKFRMTDGMEFLARNVPSNQLLHFANPDLIEIISGNRQNAQVGVPMDHPLEVQVTGSEGNALAGVPVHFEFTQGGGGFGSDNHETITLYTDLQGFARTAVTLDDISGEHHITAAVGNRDLFVTFIANLNLDKGYVLTRPDSRLLSGTAGSWLSDSIRVKLVDTNGQPVAGYPIDFIIQSGGGILAPGMSDQVEVLTDNQGIAAIAWQLGPFTLTVQKLSVNLETVDIPVANAPLEITAQAEPLAVHKLLWMGDSLRSGQAGQLLEDPLRLVALDRYDNPVPGVKVVFNLDDGNGTIGGATSLMVASASNGIVSVPWALGAIAGKWNRVHVSVYQHPLIYTQGLAFAASPRAVSMNGLSLDPEYNLNPGETIGPLTVQILDNQKEPVPNYLVTFSLPDSKGRVNDQTDSVQVVSDKDGIARCDWQPDADGAQTQILRITACRLLNSPIMVRANMVFTIPHEMTVVQANNLIAGPESRCPEPIIIAVADSLGRAIDSHPVEFRVVDGDATFEGEKRKVVLTDSLGRATIHVDMGTKAGPVSIQALSFNKEIPLVNSPLTLSARLIPGETEPKNCLLLISDPVVANKSEQNQVTLVLRDAWNNPVGQKTVSLLNSDPSLAFPSKVQTDSSGQANIQFSTTVAKTYRIHIKLGSLEICDFALTFLPGPAAELRKISGDGQQGLVNRTLDKLIMVAVVDSFSNGVPDVVLTPFVTMPSGKSVPLQTSVTDSTGIARWAWPLGPEFGEYVLTVSLSPEQIVQFHTRALTGVPVALESVSAPDPVGKRASELSEPIGVRLIDEHGNALAGFEILFEIVSGNAVLLDSHSQVSDSAGVARMRIFINENAEHPIMVSASLHDTEIELLYQIRIFDDRVRKMIMISGNHQIGAPDSVLPEALVVQVLDADDDPAPGKRVYFECLEGEGNIDPLIVVSDTLGFARAYWQLGPADSLQIARAWTDEQEIEVRFEAFLEINHVPYVTNTTDTTILHDRDFLWNLRVIDPDSHSVSVVSAELPSGMRLVTESENHFYLHWPADQVRVGEFVLMLTLDDHHGAKCNVNLHLYVLKNDHAPKLLQAVPEDSVIYGLYGDLITFNIEAFDPDGDSLSYIWMIDEQIVSSETQAVLDLSISSELPPQFFVKGIVSADGKSIEKIWLVHTHPTRVNEKSAIHEYALYQNYPNPFNPTTVIRFVIPNAGYVSLDIYNSTGQRVRSLVHRKLSGGEHSFVWDSRDDQGILLPTGVYSYQLCTQSFKESKMLIYIK